MERRNPLICPLLRRGVVSEHKRICITIITQCVTLESAPLPLVGNPKLIDMSPLKLEHLFVNAYFYSTDPCLHADCLNMIQPFTDLPVWIGSTRWVLHRKETAKMFAKQIPVRFLGNPMDIAHGYLYFASPEARYVSGVCLNIDGGAAR